MNELKAEFEDQITFDAIDATSERGDAALKAYRLRGHPSYVIVDVEGNLFWSYSGQTTATILREQMERISKGQNPKGELSAVCVF